MRKARKKTIAVCLIATFLLSSIVGCGNGKKSDIEELEKTKMTETGELKMDATNEQVKGGTDTKNYECINGMEANEIGIEGEGIPYDTEEYNAIKENGYCAVSDNPLSTFSIDVDTASYSNIRRQLQEGNGVDIGSIRLEEMMNYFQYDYKKPTKDMPFSVTTELSDCPWNKDSQLMLVGLATEEIDFSKAPASNIVFLLDVSGSMAAANKLPLVQKAFRMLTKNLTQKDRVSLVTYASQDAVLLEGVSGTEQKKIKDTLETLEAGGSTAGSQGIETAYQLAEKFFIKGGNNRVILATDGDLNVGLSSESELTKFISEKRERGVFLSVLGFGEGNLKDNKMEALADNGNGNYAYLDSLFEAKKVLVEELGASMVTVAKDVKMQVEFNPTLIKGYRLIGYENRALHAEDFEDDTKDAGEIGAGHTVTALYEIIPVNSAMQIEGSDLKYQKKLKLNTDTTLTDFADELLTVNIRYKEPNKDKSKLFVFPVKKELYSKDMSSNLNFASAVAQFGMLLRGSEYKGSATYDNILMQLSKEDFSDDVYKEEFVNLVKLAKKQGKDGILYKAIEE